MRKKLAVIYILLFSLLTLAFNSIGQENSGPVRYNPFLNNNSRITPKKSTKRTTAHTLTLPFFDDFTNAGIYPDSNNWVDFQVFINNTMCVHPISKGVATFDDLNSRGIPYDSFTNTNFRYADSLTSQPIDLSSDSLADSLYLSFYYQPQGNGFYPLAQDSLLLYMNTRYGGFVKVWATAGSSLRPFTQVMIPITDSLFFHDAFQFRFVNIAALYWADAVWNVDFVRLDRNRNIYDTAVNDIGFTSNPTFLLNDYTSMPYRQFKANPGAETAPQYTDSVRNNQVSSQPVVYGFSAAALNTGTTLQLPVLNSVTLPPNKTEQVINSSYSATIPLSSVGRYEKVVFENKHFIQSSAATGPTANDTIVKAQVFDNYLAYDDGTAEKSYYLSLYPTLPGKIAIEYHLNQPDTLRGMAVYFGRQIPFPIYKAFSIVIYSALGGVNGAIADIKLAQQDLNTPLYVDTVNHFTIYRLDDPLPLPAGTFYAGTMQLQSSGNDSIYFGLDVNRIGGNHAYFNVLNVWQPSLISGAIMIRPLLGQSVTGSGINNVQASHTQWQVAPNPAKDYIRIEIGEVRKVDYRITDIQGRNVLQGVTSHEKTIDISSLRPGLYFVTVISEGVPAVPQKFIKL